MNAINIIAQYVDPDSLTILKDYLMPDKDDVIKKYNIMLKSIPKPHVNIKKHFLYNFCLLNKFKIYTMLANSYFLNNKILTELEANKQKLIYLLNFKDYIDQFYSFLWRKTFDINTRTLLQQFKIFIDLNQKDFYNSITNTII